MQENSKKIVFLDRDGTISADSGYTAKPCDMHILPKSGKGIALLKQAGFTVVVVTNKSAIGRGFASVEDVMATNRECQLQLEAEDNNAFVDQVLFCPHKPEDNCHCRKPKTGMIDFLNPPYNFDVKSCWMVGDKISDLDF